MRIWKSLKESMVGWTAEPLSIFLRFPNQTRFNYLFLAILISSFSPMSFAQESSAGSILQDIKSQEPILVLPQAKPQIEQLSPSKGEPLGNLFTVIQIQFIGNTKLSDEVLQRLLLGFLNRPITFKHHRCHHHHIL